MADGETMRRWTVGRWMMDDHDDNNQTVHGILSPTCPFSQCPPKGVGVPVGTGGCLPACQRRTYGNDCIRQTKTNQRRGVDDAIQPIGGGSRGGGNDDNVQHDANNEDNMMDDRQRRHNNQISLHGRGRRRKMVAEMGDGRWMTTVMMTMRGNSRGRKEEKNTTLEG